METEFQPARFRIDLGLPTGEAQSLIEAAQAIRREYRDCSKWKRLTCHRLNIFAERGRGTVYVLHLGGSVEFDWTCEGAVAFRPKSFESVDNAEPAGHHPEQNWECDDGVAWAGEVLEVDEKNGCLFVNLINPDATPTVGEFYVRPFEFLAVLDDVFNGNGLRTIREQPETNLASRLLATEGDVHPPIPIRDQHCLAHLRPWWAHAWSILWGPPGTGKTWTTGQQVASILNDSSERILVVSTTNRATDAVALATGGAIGESNLEGVCIRIGKGASLRRFDQTSLEWMLSGRDFETAEQIDHLTEQMRLLETWEEKALTRKQVRELRSGQTDPSQRYFFDSEVRCVIATAFKATCFLKDKMLIEMLAGSHAPFTTVIIDEAGLMSRVAVAALSLLAAKRVVLVGDSKQLAPISRITRVLPLRQQRWLARSGLSHLNHLEGTPPAVHVLSEQRRMHPDVCRVVSDYQYDGVLTTAAETCERKSVAPLFIANHSRAIWYVLDEEDCELSEIRASRGPDNKSWVRAVTPAVLEKLISDPEFRSSKGLFISPYRAQAELISQYFAKLGLTNWEASTVHSQQGSEADVVIFDTVNAGSYGWPFEEWKRLINVAISRAREAVIVLASRAEMEEPYLKPLVKRLTQSRLFPHRTGFRWAPAENVLRTLDTRQVAETTPRYQANKLAKNGMGKQFAERKQMTPVLSQEQQHLTNLKLDGKPRLVRGVAGSGKSLVLSHWLAKTVQRLSGHRESHIWAVYANRSLHRMLQDSVELAWKNLEPNGLFEPAPFPWEIVSLLHVKDVLAGLLPEVSLEMDRFDFDYDRAAAEFLDRENADELLPRCTALFIDEAQDMGPSMLRLLLSMVQQTDESDPNSRSAHIFYDNAQNIYGRKTPKWSEMGIDMRGRSTIMRESFRSTMPVTELAVNVLHRLSPDSDRQDQAELIELGLLERTTRNGREWLEVGFSQVDGPKPILRLFDDRQQELASLFAHLKHLIGVESISPSDICVIYNGKSIVQWLQSNLASKLAEIDVELSVQTNRSFERRPNTLLVSTANSYKGYEAEVILIPGVDQFVTGGAEVLAAPLYVAMTRARSLLAVYGTVGDSAVSRKFCGTLADCFADLKEK